MKNPIRAARMVMETTGRVMFAGPGRGRDGGQGRGWITMPPEYFITPRRLEALKRALAGGLHPMDRYGTVGAVAMDGHGEPGGGDLDGRHEREVRRDGSATARSSARGNLCRRQCAVRGLCRSGRWARIYFIRAAWRA